MSERNSRRLFLQTAALGLACTGGPGFILRADARPTEASGAEEPPDTPPASFSTADHLPEGKKATEENILGPYFRAGAPYRAKITPPAAAGEIVLIRGRVWGLESRLPQPGALLDIWQADHQGRYDNDNPDQPPAEREFRYRARLLTDETGYYEFETILPGRYENGPGVWRPRHIHFKVQAARHRPLVTQLYFEGDPYNTKDPYIKKSLIIPLKPEKAAGAGASYKAGTFDIVLTRALV